MKGRSPFQRIKDRDILLFTRYLSTMITAGLPILQALDLIGREQENPLMRSKVAAIRNSIAQGKSLGESFSQFPQLFDDLYCNLIKMGEKNGSLDKVFKRLADYLEKAEGLRRKIKKALTYPSIIVLLTLGVGLALLLFVVPQFKALFSSSGYPLPFLTRGLLNFSHFLRSSFFKGFLAFGFLVLVFRYIFTHFRFLHETMDKWVLKIALIGPLLQKSIASRYARALAISLDAGIPVGEAMKWMQKVTDNQVFSKALKQACNEVGRGVSFSHSLSKSKLFPQKVMQMITLGETSGSLANILHKVADYYEEEVDSIVDYFSRFSEPLLMLLLGSIITSFAAIMYLPL